MICNWVYCCPKLFVWCWCLHFRLVFLVVLAVVKSYCCVCVLSVSFCNICICVFVSLLPVCFVVSVSCEVQLFSSRFWCGQCFRKIQPIYNKYHHLLCLNPISLSVFLCLYHCVSVFVFYWLRAAFWTVDDIWSGVHQYGIVTKVIPLFTHTSFL